MSLLKPSRKIPYHLSNVELTNLGAGNLFKLWRVVIGCSVASVCLVFGACQLNLSTSPTTPKARPENVVPTVLAKAETPTIEQLEQMQPTSSNQLAIPELVQRISPAVVHISTEEVIDDAFGRSVPAGGVGTGFIISEDGLVVTNEHVIGGGTSILVTLTDGRSSIAKLIGSDAVTDLAILKIELNNLTVAPLGQSSTLRVGETVVAIGHALDLPGGPTVTVGVISALDRTLTNLGPKGSTLSNLIQADASINPGNSGGPLLDVLGRVVGINSAGIQGTENLGFAISIDGAQEIIKELVANGRIERGFLGIASGTITRSIARRFALPVETGVFVLRVTPGSSAEKGGLLPGDIITGLGGDRIDDQGDLTRVLARNKPGAQVEITYIREEETNSRISQIVLGRRPR